MRRQSAIRLATTILVGLTLFMALFDLIQHWLHNGIVALFVLFGGLSMALYEALLFGRIPRWIDFVMKDVRNLRLQ